jgi:pyruvate dehydrogenase E1 component
MSSQIDPHSNADESLELEVQEWIASLNYLIEAHPPDHVLSVLRQLQIRAHGAGIQLPFTANTPYINTITPDREEPYPGNREIERRIRSIIRWNAMAMVVRGNREDEGIGGHISTYASAATLYEVGFNHFFNGPDSNGGDMIYFQGHAAPGIYARAYLEGRLSTEQLENFRNELHPSDVGGLPSYPHPWLMPNFWQFPTVSMGLGPIMSIYQARFNRYLEDRGLLEDTGRKVWTFMGDGECDEPEALGAITLASREQLDNLVFVVNCNLQRLDGPVRGNGKIIQELEATFRGAGWNVIKVIWGGDWDPLLAKDKNDVLVRRMQEVVDGQYQKYTVESGSYIRDHFFGAHPELRQMVSNLTDERIRKLNRGGHDPVKVYAAFKAAVEHKGQPTIILAKTVKGYGLGESGEGRNITHQQKKLNEDELREFRTRFAIPVSDRNVANAPFYKPPEDAPEMKYLHDRRQERGGSLPQRSEECDPIEMPQEEAFNEFLTGSGDRTVSTTGATVRMLTKLLQDPNVGRYIVPIVPDEARTFGMDSLFRQVGIYSHVGQLYEPVDSDSLLYYKEAKDGQILEEGITEAGSMSSFIAAGTAYSTHGIPTIPFFIFYSMFGMQRIGDLVWAAGDSRCRGFMFGATAGRTTLAGEGLQHQDGQSHLLADPVPNVCTFDPAFAYEIAVIVRDGIRRMYVDQESIFYYITVENESFSMPSMPQGAEEGILKGMYLLDESSSTNCRARVQLLGSGAILNEAIRAQGLLETEFNIAADLWSVTSYKELRRDGMAAERDHRLHPHEPLRTPYITACLAGHEGPVVAASDYVKNLPDGVRQWIPNTMVTLGTDGFGRSDNRERLRSHFEVDAEHIALGALYALMRDGVISAEDVNDGIKKLGIQSDKVDPIHA